MSLQTLSKPISQQSPIVSILVLSLLFLGGCATKPNNSPLTVTEETETDPYEGFNRNMYAFNDSVDNYVASPITDAYKFVTPNLVQTGVSNFFTNLGNVSVVLNDVLQGKVQQGAEDTGRLLINSTLGVFGLFDVAAEMGLHQNQEDFGQTLAVWGVPTGPYVVMPFLGPTTFRGMPGAAVDIATNPITYIGIPALQAASVVNSRANADGALQFIDEAALDPYVFTREAYLQWRQHLSTDGAEEAESDPLSNFEDELFKDEELYQVEIQMEPETASKHPTPTQDVDTKPETDSSTPMLDAKKSLIVDTTEAHPDSNTEATETTPSPTQPVN